MDELISHSATRWSLPIAIFLFVYGVFKFLDANASLEVKRLFSEFLQQYRYESYLGKLPVIIETTFVRFFSNKHLSLKCIFGSVVLSWCAIIVALLFTFLYNRTALINMVANDLANANALARNNRGAALNVSAYEMWAFYVVAWIFWGVIPDYLALLKIRILLTVMKHTKPGIASLCCTVIIDFVVGVWTFLTSYTVLVAVGSLIFVGGLSSIRAEIIWLGAIFGIEVATDLITGYVFIKAPIDNMFWASMLPSMWLWAYIGSSLLTRMLAAARPTLRKAVYVFDVTNHPVRCVGLVAAFVSAVVCRAVLVGLSFI